MSTFCSSLISVSALNTLGSLMGVITHNITNVSTSVFVPVRAEIKNEDSYMGIQFGDNPNKSTLLSDHKPSGPSIQRINTNFAEKMLPSSQGTRVSYELTKMLSLEHAFNANAAALLTTTEMLETVIHIRT